MNTKCIRIGSALTLAVLFSSAALPTQAGVHKRATGTRVETFQVAANSRIVVGSNHSASLADLKPGDHVSVAYDQENGILVAHRIVDGVVPHPHNPNGTPKAKNAPAQSRPVLAHAQGVLEAVDAQAGTVTVAVTPHHRRL